MNCANNDSGNDKWHIRYGAVSTLFPGGTPYSAAFLLAFMPGPGVNLGQCGVGWYDGTKMHALRITVAGSAPPLLYVSTYSGVQVWNNNAINPAVVPQIVWLKLKDDGTNVIFYYSVDGVTWVNLYQVAKSAGYLGSSGYTNIFWGIAMNGTVGSAKLLGFVTGT
jgi:hypothetical protein